MRSFRHIHLALAAAIALTALPLGMAEAQTVVGTDRKPAVEVDLSVLDRLGTEPTLPDRFLNRHPQSRTPAVATTEKIILKRPVKKTAAKPTEPAAKAPPKSVAKAAPKPESLLPAKSPEPTVQAAAEPAPAPRTESEPSDAVKTPEAKTEAPIPVPSDIPVQAATPAPAPIETDAAPAKTATAETGGETTASAGGGIPPRSAAPAAPSVPAPADAVPATTAKAAVDTKTTPPVQSTAAPQSPAVSLEGSISLAFDPNGAVLSTEALQNLDKIAARLNGDDSLNLLLMAYASSSDDSASRARHLSLSRALAVRSNLIDRGVRSTRIEVRALGNKTPGGNPDRVDLILQKR